MSAAKGGQKKRLVQETASRLRDIIMAHEPDAQVGSLTDLSEQLGVGIVTVQQAARILEHEGLLAVRRGPGGGYYGKRPDEAALERSLAAFLRVHGFGYLEAFEMIVLLDCDIFPAAARSADEAMHTAMRELRERIDSCETADQRIAFEDDLRQLLFRMVPRPLMEFVVRATSRIYRAAQINDTLYVGAAGVDAWRTGRQRMLEAVLRRDEALAEFEAIRYRRDVMARIRAREKPGATG